MTTPAPANELASRTARSAPLASVAVLRTSPLTGLATLVLVLVLGIPAIWPFTEFRFLSSHDGTYHLLRLVEFDRLLRAGELFPGWMPDFAVGYGYPLLRFYPPLGYYPAELLHLLGFGYVDAIKAALSLAILLSGVGAYLLGRDLFGSRYGGVLLAAGLMYAPYHLIDTYVRAILSESWVFPFLPLVLWSLGRAAKGSRLQVMLGAVFFAGAVLAHNVIALFFMPVVALYSLALVWRAASRRTAGMYLLATVLLGLMISAAYWLPALGENQYVSTSNFNTAEYRPENNLNAFDELISTDLKHEYAQSPFRFGLFQSLLAVAGLAALPFARRRRWILVFGLGIAAGFGLLLTPVMAWIWAVVPLIAYVQFPTRLLGLAAIGTAMLTGALALLPNPFRWIGVPGLAALIVSGVATISPPVLRPSDSDLTVGTLARFEYDSGIIGTTTAAEYLPIWARAGFVPPTEGFATPVKTADDPVVRATVVQAAALGLRLQTQADHPGPLRFHIFYFPGWTVWIDGEARPVYPSTEIGLLTVDVPEGEHAVTVQFLPTPLRLAAAALSSAGILLALLFAFGVRWGAGIVASIAIGLVALQAAVNAVAPAWTPLSAAGNGDVRLTGGRARPVSDGAEIELYWQAMDQAPADRSFGVRLVAADGSTVAEKWSRPVFATTSTEAWHKNEIVRDLRVLQPSLGRTGGSYAIEVAQASGGWQRVGEIDGAGGVPYSVHEPLKPMGQTFGGLFRLDGVSVHASGGTGERVSTPEGLSGVLLPGDQVHLRLVWTALKDTNIGYTVFVHLVGPDGKGYGQQDNQPGDGFSPTVLWQTGAPVDDDYYLTLPKDAPAGLYRLNIGWYWLANLERLNIDGTPVSALTAATFKVSGERRPVPDSVPVFGGQIALIAAERKGNALSLGWQATGAVHGDYTMFVHVVDATGKIVSQFDGPPGGDGYPTGAWSPTEVIMDKPLQVDIPEGGSAQVGLYSLGTGVRLKLPDGRDYVTVNG